MTELKWKIDTIRTVLFSNEKLKFKKKEWSKIITGQDIFNEMTQEENGKVTQYIEMTNIESNKQFNLVYVEEQNVLDLQLVFQQDQNTYSYNEITEIAKIFFEKNKALFDTLEDPIIRIGNVIELSISIDDEKSGCNLLKNNVPYLNGIDDNLDEINFRINKSYIHNNIKINRVIQYAIGQKMTVSIDPKMGIPKANLQKNILMNIDVNTDASHKSKLDLESFHSSLQESVLNIIKNRGVYVSH